MNSLLQPDPLQAAATQRTRIQNQAFQAAVNGEPLVNSLNILARIVKLELEIGVRTAFYLAYPDGKRLHAIEGAGDMDPAYTAPLNGFPVGDDSFCSGYAMATGRPVHTQDVFQAPQWQPYLPMATAHQFRAASSYPILTRQGKAIGSLALYFPDVHQATAQEAALAKAITQAAAIILSQDTQITEHTRAEEALRQSQEKYRTLFETIDEGYAFCQLVRDQAGRATDYRILELNPAFEQQIGARRADFLGRTARQVFPGYDDWWIDTYARAVDTNQPVHFEHPLDNTGRWYTISAYPHGGDHFAVLFQDITERKRHERQQAFLLRFSDRLRLESDADALANQALQLLTEHLQLDRCCIAVYRLTDDQADITHQVGNDRLPPMPQCLRRSDLPDAFSIVSEGTLVIDEVGQTKGLTELDRQTMGAWGFSALVASPLRQRAHQPMWVILAVSARPRPWRPVEIQLIEEVTERIWAAMERIKADEALRNSEAQYRHLSAHLDEQVRQRTAQLEVSVRDLKRSNDNLEQFASIASHDLQEPLRKVQQFGDLLTSQYGPQLGQGVRYLDRMQLAASRMSILIKDLLTFSRISTRQEAGTPISLSEIVAGVLSDLELQIEETGAQVIIEPLPTIVGEGSQLGQLFANLLGNALKFRRPQAQPKIRVSSHRLAAGGLPLTVRPTRMAPAYYQIDVSDNGIGFEQKYVERIFQIFQRLHGKGEFAGTGIGLAICEKVVTNHGGAITAHSQPGEGAIFSIYLPA
ncbi:ATP-binding protein [Spirosoma radiotolerans]|uniref:ATP-binding protein n=1 Tax=Spirosoma radiotolerans TaxID=1379870 RepID=UPI0006966C2B|nr:ATP-binding protein [Spirosoma radiotolerans]